MQQIQWLRQKGHPEECLHPEIIKLQNISLILNK
jgi:hypothetical protein